MDTVEFNGYIAYFGIKIRYEDLESNKLLFFSTQVKRIMDSIMIG
jgi:hypothetical protein